MRRFNHWSPRYVTARLQNFLYQKIHPDRPWLTPDAVNFLGQWLKPEDQGVEFGSGISTIWFANRVSRLLSIENNPEWYHKVKQWLHDAGLNNVNYVLAAEVENESDQIRASKYIKPGQSLPDISLDFVLVDGRWRSECANIMINKLKPGGLMIIDNANLYLPSDSRSPNSQTIEQGPLSKTWQIYWESIADWRRFWTSNGVFDTVIFIKPNQ